MKLLRYLLLSALLIIVLATGLFFYFQPNQAEDNKMVLNQTMIRYEDLKYHLQTEPKAFFFCVKSDQNCVYTENEIIKPLLNNAGVSTFDQIHYVDASALDKNLLPSAIKQRLGFTHYPAFVVLSQEGDKITVHSVLAWNDSVQLSQYDLKNWMKENKLWLDTYLD